MKTKILLAVIAIVGVAAVAPAQATTKKPMMKKSMPMKGSKAMPMKGKKTMPMKGKKTGMAKKGTMKPAAKKPM